MLPLQSYEEKIVRELQEKDGLVILGTGLGLNRILLELIKEYSNARYLVFLLNLSNRQQTYLKSRMPSDLISRNRTLRCIDGEMDRIGMYSEGGCFSISSRLISVDLLSGRLLASRVTGFIVNQAHDMQPESREVFPLLLFRSLKPSGFIMGLSDQPNLIQMNKVLRAIFVSEVYLWPRFHVEVFKSFEGKEPDVVELKLELPSSMKQLMDTIVALLESCLQELEKCQYIDRFELNLENACHSYFDTVMQRSIDPHSHFVGISVRHLLADIKFLRKLMFLLLRADCATFYTYLFRQSLVYSEHAFWQTNETHKLISLAKRRVYRVKSSTVPNLPTTIDQLDIGTLDVSFPINPKWDLLKSILNEIMENVKGKKSVVIVVNDEHIIPFLVGFLDLGHEAFSKQVWNRFLKSQSRVFEKHPLHSLIFDSTGEKITQRSLFNSSLQRETILLMQSLHEVSSNGISFDFSEDCQLLFGDLTLSFSLPWTFEYDLLECSPSFVVLFEPKLSCIRQLELFKARKPSKFLRIYMMLYIDSIDELKFTSSLKFENDAFERLIKSKVDLVLPSDIVPSPRCILSKTSRSGKLDNNVIVVDIREFNSHLPVALYHFGFKIVPLTISIGDYILSNNIVVERKALGDLISSLASGRLFAQVSSMITAYKKAVLLIEFDHNKSFSIQPLRDMSSDIDINSVNSKLSLLVLHFPTLSICWSRSVRQTAALFADLKQGESNPNIDMFKNGDKLQMPNEKSNSAMELLTRIPGVTSDNIHKVILLGKTIRDIAALPLEKFVDSIGDLNGKRVYNFFHDSVDVSKL